MRWGRGGEEGGSSLEIGFGTVLLLNTTDNVLVKVKPGTPSLHPGICGALVGLHHHVDNSLSPQYVGDSLVFSLLF